MTIEDPWAAGQLRKGALRDARLAVASLTSARNRAGRISMTCGVLVALEEAIEAASRAVAALMRAENPPEESSLP